MAVSLQ